MRVLLLLPLLLTLMPRGQDGVGSGDRSPVVVVSSTWSKSRQTVVNPNAGDTGPAPAMTAANKVFERSKRVNDPAGVRDPNADTLDTRSAAIERNVQEARVPKSKTVEGYEYRVKVRDAGAKAVEVLFWEYQFAEAANPSNVVRRQFLCGVAVKPGKEKELVAFSASGPAGVVSAGSLAASRGKTFQERAVINRVEYADGSVWQRKDWNFGEVRAGVARATATPWGLEMCRGL